MNTSLIINVPGEYISLGLVLQSALEQASKGKGKERHAESDELFENQIICEVARRTGTGFCLGQAVKKIYESQRLDGIAGVNELLGAINYIAAAVIVAKEELEDEDEEARRDHKFLESVFAPYAEKKQEFKPGDKVQYHVTLPSVSDGMWVDAEYDGRLSNGREHTVKTEKLGLVVVDGKDIRPAPKAEGCEEPEFKCGDKVQARLSDGVWRDAVVSGKEITCGKLYYTVKVADFNGYYSLQADDVRPASAPKAEGCESLVREDGNG